MKNRDKILTAAKRLFNDHGFVNVRLQHISDDTIISVGNIAYHFKNKEAIVSQIFEELEQKQKDLLIEYRHTPIFANVDRIFSVLRDLQEEYSFFFTDIVEIKRAYPLLFEKINQFFRYQVLLFEEIIRFNISRGALLKEETEQHTHFLASLIIKHLSSWKTFSITWQENTNEHVEAMSDSIWRILYPYMSKSGKEEYHINKEQKVKIYPADKIHESKSGQEDL